MFSYVLNMEHIRTFKGMLDGLWQYQTCMIQAFTTTKERAKANGSQPREDVTKDLAQPRRSCLHRVWMKIHTYILSTGNIRCLGTEEMRTADACTCRSCIVSKVFNELSNLREPYKISWKDDTLPHTQSTARRIPLALQGQFKTESDKTLAQGVILKVDGATSSCIGMVVVPKKLGQIRICINLKSLN